MRRSRRTALGTYSASAIDLFASALGAFIIITIVALPYFPNLARVDLQGRLDEVSAERDRMADALADATSNRALIGVETELDRFHLLLDLSWSTTGAGGGVDYRPQLRAIVSDIVSRLPEGARLKVSTFAGSTRSPKILRWRDGRFQSDVDQAALAEIMGDLRRWQAAITRMDATPTFAAVSEALTHGEPVSIFVITDGVPSAPRGTDDYGAWLDAEVERMARLNTTGHEINIVALGGFVYAENVNRIVSLATENSGAFVALPSR